VSHEPTVARQLREMGVTWAQGFHFHRPERLSADLLHRQAQAVSQALAEMAVDPAPRHTSV